MDIKIRRANALDISDILKLIVKYLEGAGVHHYPPMSNQAGVWIADLVQNHIIIVADVHGEIAGMLAFKELHFLWNESAHCLAAELFMVDPEYRSSSVAVELIKKSKELGDTLGIPVLCGVMTGVDAELKDRFTRMCGFKYIGGNFIYGGK